MKRMIVVLAASLLVALPVDAGPQKERGNRVERKSDCCQHKSGARDTVERKRAHPQRRVQIQRHREPRNDRAQARVQRFVQRRGRDLSTDRGGALRRQGARGRSSVNLRRDAVRSEVRRHVAERQQRRGSSRAERGNTDERFKRPERRVLRSRQDPGTESQAKGKERGGRAQSGKGKLEQRIEALKKKRSALEEKLERLRERDTQSAL